MRSSLALVQEYSDAAAFLAGAAEAQSAAKFGAVLGSETPNCGLFNSAAVEGVEAVSSLKPR